jgi:hypothetical protein
MFFPFANQFGGEEASFCAIFTQNESPLFGLKTAYLPWFYWVLSPSSRQGLKFFCCFRIEMMLLAL